MHDEELDGYLDLLSTLPTGKGEPVQSLTDKAIRSSLKEMRRACGRCALRWERAWPSPT